MELNIAESLGIILSNIYKIHGDKSKYETFSKNANSVSRSLIQDDWLISVNKYGNTIGFACITKNTDKNPLKNYSNKTISTDADYSTLIYFLAEKGSGKILLQQLRDRFKHKHKTVIYLRTKNGRRIVKIISCEDTTNFMRSRSAPEEEAIPFLQTAAARDFYLPTYHSQMAFAECVGEMALLMVHAPVAAASPFRPVIERIQTCARLEQRRFYASHDGGNTGLLTWAWLTSKRLLQDFFDTNALQAFEWSEGPHLAVVDVVVSAETENLVWDDLGGQLYPDEDIWVLCQAEEKTYFKKWPKDQRGELLTNTQARSEIVFGIWEKIALESCAP